MSRKPVAGIRFRIPFSIPLELPHGWRLRSMQRELPESRTRAPLEGLSESLQEIERRFRCVANVSRMRGMQTGPGRGIAWVFYKKK